MKQELLAMICCPNCKADLIYDEKKSALICSSCKAIFDVNDGIPILLPKTN